MKVQLTESESINIGIGELAEDIYQHAKYLRATFEPDKLWTPEEDKEGATHQDCRLRVFEGYWWFYTGDSSYDTDHRGFWSASSIPYHCTREQSREIARELIEGLE